MIHILVSGITANFGGMEKFVVNYYTHMDRSKVQFDVLTEADHPAYEDVIQKNGGRIWHITARSKDCCGYMKNVERIFAEHARDYDIFWCNKCMLNNITYLQLAKKYGIPIRIIHSHNSSSMDTGVKGLLMRVLHEVNKRRLPFYATDFWACSDYAAEWFYGKKIIHSEKYKFIPNAVSMEELHYREQIRDEYRKRLSIDQDTLLVGNVGRLNYQKNHEFLVEIFCAVHRKKSNSRLLLIGVGELQESIETNVKNRGLSDAVCFLGQSQEVSAWMQAMDCFLLPSRFEGLPVVAVEAQAAGLPVVAARDGISPQTKITDTFEFLSLSDSPDTWADAVIRLANSTRKDTTAEIAKAGFEITAAGKEMEQTFEAMASTTRNKEL